MTVPTSAPPPRRLSLGYEDRLVIDGLDLNIPAGQITAIVGANACGKSTLLQALARLLGPRSGAVLLDGQAIHRLPTQEVARRSACCRRRRWHRRAHRHRPGHPRAGTAPGLVAAVVTADEEAVTGALDVTGTTDLTDRAVDELSGGQRQRVWIAMAIAQQTGCCCWTSRPRSSTSPTRSTCSTWSPT